MIEVRGPSADSITLNDIHNFMRVRKTHFVDGMEWDVPHTDHQEFDQYDMPDALFAVAYKDGECIGGARIAPTNTPSVDFFGTPRSYMLADFLSRKIGGLTDQHLTEPLPRSPEIWEMTRFISPTPQATKAILAAINEYLKARNASHVLTLSPKLMPRVLKKLGYDCTTISAPIYFDGKASVVIKTKVRA